MGRSTTWPPWSATCATCAGSTAGSAVSGSAATRRGARGARGDLSLLDVGTGGADIPLASCRAAGRARPPVTVVGLDSRPEVLAAAVGEPAASDDGLELHARRRPVAPLCRSLVRHHPRLAGAPPPGAGTRPALLREMARVARLGVIVNDLHRGRIAWLGAWLMGHLLTGNRYTRNDAPLSVRRPTGPARRPTAPAAGLTPLRTIRGILGIATRSRPDRTGRGRRHRRRGHRSDGRTGRDRGDRRRTGRRRRWRRGLRASGHDVMVLRARRRPGAGGPAASSRHRRRWRRSGAGRVDAGPPAVARPIPAMRVETPPGRCSG